MLSHGQRNGEICVSCGCPDVFPGITLVWVGIAGRTGVVEWVKPWFCPGTTGTNPKVSPVATPLDEEGGEYIWWSMPMPNWIMKIIFHGVCSFGREKFTWKEFIYVFRFLLISKHLFSRKMKKVINSNWNSTNFIVANLVSFFWNE